MPHGRPRPPQARHLGCPATAPIIGWLSVRAGAYYGVAGWLSGLARFRRPGGLLLRQSLDPDRLKASLGDAHGARNVPVAPPHRQRTAGLEPPRPGPRQGAWPPPCRPHRRSDVTAAPGHGRREAAASSRSWVSVSFTESSIRLRRRLAPPPPKPRNGQEAGGAGIPWGYSRPER
jgi:hypothetical protein